VQVCYCAGCVPDGVQGGRCVGVYPSSMSVPLSCAEAVPAMWHMLHEVQDSGESALSAVSSSSTVCAC